jgi:hypothetical protein
MLQIRPEHYQAYLDERLGPSRRRMMAALRAHLPEEISAGYSELDLGSLCDRAMFRAAAYGMTTERNVYYVAAAMALCGEWFEDDPRRAWKRDFLDDRLMDQDIKSSLLALNLEIETGKRI